LHRFSLQLIFSLDGAPDGSSLLTVGKCKKGFRKVQGKCKKKRKRRK
jgi:hypothetical protein